MTKHNPTQDRNFDDLAKRFKHNIYGGLKGDIRLAVLERDCILHLPIPPYQANSVRWRILDAGGGQGQFSLELAKAGHQVVICDISAEMLSLAEAQIKLLGLEARVTLIHCALQDLAEHLPQTNCRFDFVICHAVMEWMRSPQELLPCLLKYLLPSGYLSLIFYNVHSLILKNLLRTNFKKIINKDYGGARGSLTPLNPIQPEQVLTWLSQLPLELLCFSGIRVFHDYIFNEDHRKRDPETLLALELELSQQEPYKNLGRYMHFLMHRKAD